MTKIVGVRFRNAGKIYYFDPADKDMENGTHVIVETARGVEFGVVMIPPKEVEDEKVTQPLKPVIRIATDEDEKQQQKNKEKQENAYKICLEKIEKHGLEMKLVQAEYTFDNNKLLFYFTADGRIDFRELVKDLAAVFRTRIELRQIGVRDETKILGGIGICGRQLCCSSYLSEFVPVSIKMAKEQNLSLNPTKISGVCGRLMCCLKYENEVYEEKLQRLPNVGAIVKTEDGEGEVDNIEILKEKLRVKFKNEEGFTYKKYDAKDVKIIKDVAKEQLDEEEIQNKKELEELEKLEQEDKRKVKSEN